MSRIGMRVDHQIPIVDPRLFAQSYMDIPVDGNDPRGREPLIPLESVGVAFESYHARTDGGNPPYFGPVEGSRRDVWLRKTPAEKLARVNEHLRPFEAEVLVLDGYRPIACQRALWNFYWTQAKRQDPGAGEQQWRAYALQFAADPANFDENDFRTWSAHTTGAAADLSLRDLKTKELLDMGAEFESIADESIADYYERQLRDGRIAEDDVRLQNRRLLNWAMTREGLLNETSKVFWHYDWGNQTYVRAARAFLSDPPRAAWYGYIRPPA